MFIYCNTQEIKRIQAFQLDTVYMWISDLYIPQKWKDVFTA